MGYYNKRIEKLEAALEDIQAVCEGHVGYGPFNVITDIINNALEYKPHWAKTNPGLADQYKMEALACREALGFSKHSEDVAPVDLIRRISELSGR